MGVKVSTGASASSGASARNVQSISYAAAITPAAGTAGADQVVNVATLTGGITVNTPSGTPVDGQIMVFRFATDGTAGRAITWGAGYVFGTDVPAALVPTGANSNFEIAFAWRATAGKWRARAIVRGF